MTLDLFKFILFLIFFVLSPALFIEKLFKEHRKENGILHLGKIITVGMFVIVALSVLLGLLKLPIAVVWILPAISFPALFSCIRKKLTFNPTRLPLILILVFGSILQCLVLIRGGILTDEGIRFPSLHDTGWNMSLLVSLTRSFPPEHPALSGEILKNNHYFYPFFLAVSQQLFRINMLDLYFRFGPLLVSFLFGISIYAFSSIFIKKEKFRLFAVIFGYFGGNLSYVTLLFFGEQFDWRGNTFYADQPFDQMINPYTVLGLSFALFSLYFLYHYLLKPSNYLFIISAITFGMLFGFKSFGGILVILSLILFSGVLLMISFFKPEIRIYAKNIVRLLIITLAIFSATFFLISEIGKSSLVFAPGWLLNQMVMSSTEWSNTNLGSTETYYAQINNVTGLLKIKGIEMVIYTIGNYGTRLIGLFFIPFIFLQNKDRKEIKWFLIPVFIFIFFSYLIPHLFNLKYSSFNIIQFTPYSFVILDILTVAFLVKLYEIVNRPYRIIILVLSLIIMLISFPVNVKNISSIIHSPGGDLVSRDEYDALTFISKKTPKESIILVDPEQNKIQSFVFPIHVRFLSKRPVYFVHEDYLSQTGIDDDTRQRKVRFFFDFPSMEFLREENISYVYIIKIPGRGKSQITIQSLSLPIFYENETVAVYEV